MFTYRLDDMATFVVAVTCTHSPVVIGQLKLIVACKSDDMCISIQAVVAVTCTRGPVSIKQLKLLHTD